MNPSVKQLAVKLNLDGYTERKRIGLMILSTDHVTEGDFYRLVPRDGIDVYATRVPFANPVTRENLRAMQPALTEGAALILPGESLDVVMYSCTSASVMIGDEAIVTSLRTAKPDATIVTPTIAVIAALKALKAKRISLLAPYTVEVSEAMATYFSDRGFIIDAVTCLGLTDDREMARISHDEIVQLGKMAMPQDSDALFISCTGMRAAAVVKRIETSIGKSVVSSNLATAWMCSRLCGNADVRPELGSLMSQDLLI